jgi:hypothetical protein
MFDALSFAEIDGQHAELLPARTVLSLFSASGGGSSSVCSGNGANTGGLIGGVNVIGDLLNGPILSNCGTVINGS